MRRDEPEGDRKKNFRILKQCIKKTCAQCVGLERKMIPFHVVIKLYDLSLKLNAFRGIKLIKNLAV